MSIRARRLEIEAPRTLRVREEALADPAEGELVVRTLVSAISAGTELLFYRGEIEEGTPLDETLSALGGTLRYPLAYGYASVGEVVATGPQVPQRWLGARVFAFTPHCSHFLVHQEEVFPLPPDAEPERAALLPTAETAVNFLLDGGPHIGEKVLVVGQGVVGLVTTALLARFPLARLCAVERVETRRNLSVELGADEALAPEDLRADDFDLAFELSSQPVALNSVIAAMAQEGRIVVGSWYGGKRAPIDLGTRFHRKRLRLLSSQVSHIGASHLPRWSKERRLQVAWNALARIPVDTLVTHRFPLERASEAYRLLDQAPHECLQILLSYT